MVTRDFGLCFFSIDGVFAWDRDFGVLELPWILWRWRNLYESFFPPKFNRGVAPAKENQKLLDLSHSGVCCSADGKVGEKKACKSNGNASHHLETAM